PSRRSSTSSATTRNSPRPSAGRWTRPTSSPGSPSARSRATSWSRRSGCRCRRRRRRPRRARPPAARPPSRCRPRRPTPADRPDDAPARRPDPPGRSAFERIGSAAMAYETVTGYCWPQSVEGGDVVGLHLSSARGRPVSVEVARVGAERTVVHVERDVPAEDHPTPPDAATAGRGWPAAMALTVDPSWRSGYYEVLLEIELDGKRRQSHAFFVVRPPAGRPTARILLALSTNTWHAYNDFGGRNLYTGATQVSLQRPMARGYLHKPPGLGRRVTTTAPPDPQMAAHVGYLQLNHLSAWAGSAGWPDWEQPFLAWAEREGYAIDVVTNADLEDHPELLAGDDYSLYLSVGHDEYWSGPMRDTVEGFIARGGNAAFLSGNTSFWQ